jgi:hypothetical protein
MNGLDLKVLAVIGISALTGMVLTSMLFQRSGEVESLDPDVKIIEIEVESGEVVPEWSFRWRTTEAPIWFSGPGSAKPIRNPSPSLWNRRTAPTGLPGFGSSFFTRFPSTWERSVAHKIQFEFRTPLRWEAGGARRLR